MIEKETLCYGLLACEKAHDYLLGHRNDVAGAKEIAATYCISHMSACKNNALGFAVGNTLGHAAVDLILASEGLKSGGPCSFDSSTPVLLKDGKTKPIGKIKPGDKVEAASPEDGKRRGPREVTATLIHHDTDLLDIQIRDQHGRTGTLHTTSRHPFWDDTTDAWVPAAELTPGHALGTPTDQRFFVARLQTIPGSSDMYNLTVADLHTYYVLAGQMPVLVHNSGEGETNPWANAREWPIGQKFPTGGDGRDAVPGPSNGILYRTGVNGEMTNYSVYDEDGIILRRVDLVGESHKGVDTPHVQEYLRNEPHGRVYPYQADIARPTGPEDLPPIMC
jgi:hypothetical protein